MSKTVLPLVFLLACNASPRNTVPPEKAAEAFAADLHIPIQGRPSCTGVDTDGDGYVTCTLSLPSDVPKLISIQCAALVEPSKRIFIYATGCKETQPKIQAVQAP